jgi:hypothetical protein
VRDNVRYCAIEVGLRRHASDETMALSYGDVLAEEQKGAGLLKTPSSSPASNREGITTPSALRQAARRCFRSMNSSTATTTRAATSVCDGPTGSSSRKASR